MKKQESIQGGSIPTVRASITNYQMSAPWVLK